LAGAADRLDTKPHYKKPGSFAQFFSLGGLFFLQFLLIPRKFTRWLANSANCRWLVAQFWRNPPLPLFKPIFSIIALLSGGVGSNPKSNTMRRIIVLLLISVLAAGCFKSNDLPVILTDLRITDYISGEAIRETPIAAFYDCFGGGFLGGGSSCLKHESMTDQNGMTRVPVVVKQEDIQVSDPNYFEPSKTHRNLRFWDGKLRIFPKAAVIMEFIQNPNAIPSTLRVEVSVPAWEEYRESNGSYGTPLLHRSFVNLPGENPTENPMLSLDLFAGMENRIRIIDTLQKPAAIDTLIIVVPAKGEKKEIRIRP
jgi:hypothetical protein